MQKSKGTMSDSFILEGCNAVLDLLEFLKTETCFSKELFSFSSYLGVSTERDAATASPIDDAEDITFKKNNDLSLVF